jgi:regulator of protease activity HflC (stomatin/prohibitin superfamily)
MVPGCWVLDCWGVEPTVLLVVAALAVVTTIGCAAVVRIVPAGHCGVVLRGGRPARSRLSGLFVLLPGIERVAMVPCQPRPIDPLSVNALTRDGVEVRLVISVLWRVADFTLAAQAKPDLWSATADAVDRALHHLVASVDLAALLRERETVLARLPAADLPLVARLGVELIDVDLLDAEVRVGPELLRLLA